MRGRPFDIVGCQERYRVDFEFTLRETDSLELSSPVTIHLDNGFSCRLYDDARPHYLEISQLQKGLVLLIDGCEVIEEGVGFGAPVVVYQDRPFFSSSARTSFQSKEDHKTLIKSFMIYTISKKKLGKSFYLHDRFYRFFQRCFHTIYTRNKNLAPFLTVFIELMKTCGINTEFQKVNPRGVITLKYSFLPDLIEVDVSLCRLDKKGCKEILVLNEQGASFFRNYLDTDGLNLSDGQIGAWELTRAKEVFLFDLQKKTGFSLKNKDGAVLLRGREKVRERYSWVGFSYSLTPKSRNFCYSIRLISSVVRDDGTAAIVPINS